MNVIGFTSHEFGNHDNSVALIQNGKLVFAEAEERASRIKHDRSFPHHALTDALSFAHLSLTDIDLFVSASPPTTTYKMLSTYRAGMKDAGIRRFASWIGRRMVSRTSESLEVHDSYKTWGIPPEKLHYVSHQDAHAATAYYQGPYDSCLVVALDGYGIDTDGTSLAGKVYLASNGKLNQVETIPIYASLALYYGAVTVALDFKLNDGEGKTMGLAAYGNPYKCYKEMASFFPEFRNGQWQGTPDWLDVNTVSRLDFFRSTPVYLRLSEITARYGKKHVAAASQQILEERSCDYMRYLKDRYAMSTFAVAGGIFLNVKMNKRLQDEKIAKKLWIYPNPGDSGVAAGAAILGHVKKYGSYKRQELKHPDLGISFTNDQIRQAAQSFGSAITITKLSEKELIARVATQLTKGVVVGWFQGRAEWGPRALGQRSVLADPRRGAIKERINKKMKKRDWFMPFAPSMLSEHSKEYLCSVTKSPFMIMADTVMPNKLSDIIATVHVDNTVRPQIVERRYAPRYWAVINEFYKRTGVPVVLNTSFNKHGLPMVHAPQEAIEHLLWGCVDMLAIGDYIVTIRRSKKRSNLKQKR